MLIDEIKKIEENLKDAEIIKIKAETSLSTLRKEYKKIEDEIRDLGILDIAKAEEELNRKKEDLTKKVNELKNLIPINTIEKFKNYDFSSDLEEDSCGF